MALSLMPGIPATLQEVIRRSTSAGEVSALALAKALARNAALDWEGVGDVDGNVIPVSPEALDALLDIGALIVGAGELLYWFGRLVKGAGGFGAAMGLLKNVAVEVWDRIKIGGKSLGLVLATVWTTVETGWLRMLASIQKKWADFLHKIAGGLRDVPGTDTLALKLGGAAIMAGSAYYEMAAAADAAKNKTSELAISAVAVANAAKAPLQSIKALSDAVKTAGEGGVAALNDTGTAADNVAATIAKAGGAAGKAAEIAKTAWASAAGSLKDYASKAADMGKGLGDQGNRFQKKHFEFSLI